MMRNYEREFWRTGDFVYNSINWVEVARQWAFYILLDSYCYDSYEFCF